MSRIAKGRTRRILWWWAAGLVAAASMLVLHSGAYASRPTADELWPNVETLLGSRQPFSVEAKPEDAGVLRERYEALRERRQRIEDALPRAFTMPPQSRRPSLGGGVPEPPRMDSGDPNPDGLLFLPAGGDGSMGGER